MRRQMTMRMTYDLLGECYEQIEDTTARIPKKDFMIIQEDWNEKVGSNSHAIWSKATGRYGLGNTNQRGNGNLIK